MSCRDACRGRLANYADILLIVPPAYYLSISDHISEHYSLIAYPRARIEIKRHGDGEEDEDEDQGPVQSVGTARLLKRFRSYIKVGLHSFWPDQHSALIPSV